MTFPNIFKNSCICFHFSTDFWFLTLQTLIIDYTGLRLKNFFKRSKVFQLILAYFDALNPNILSIFFGQVKFLRYV